MDEQFGNEEQVDQPQEDGGNDGSGMVEQVEQPAEDGSPESQLQTEQPDQPVPAEPQPAAPVESPAPAEDSI